MTIRLDGVTIRASATGTVLTQDVTCELPDHGFATLTGPSGGGKTALAHCFLGWVRPGLSVTGTISVNGVDPFDLTRAELRRFRSRTVGYVDQDPSTTLDPHQRVSTVLAELEARRGAGTNVARALGLAVDTDFVKRRIGQISGGQCRRVAIARHAAAEPSLLILDEPSVGLDGRARTHLIDELSRLTDEFAGTVLVVTHDRELVDGLAPGVRLRLAEGRVTTDRTRATALPVAPKIDIATTVLSASGLTAGHRGSPPVCRDFSLEVGAHEGVAIVGPSGSGKTTIARAITGLLTPSSGTVAIDGRTLPPTLSRRSPQQRRQIGVVPQDAAGSLDPRRTVGQVLSRHVGLGDPSCSPDSISTRVRALLTDVGLEQDMVSRKPSELFGGQRQRVCVARALAASPRVLICDEATAAVDDTSRRIVLDTLVRFRDEHPVALVVVTHDDDVAAMLCHRRIHLSDSAFNGTTPSLIAPAAIVGAES